MSIVTNLRYTANLDRGVIMTPITPSFMGGDQEAHRFVIDCYRQNSREAVDLSGAGVTAYFLRADGVTIPLVGETDGNAASVLLPAACYAVQGRFSLAVKLSLDDGTADSINTIFWGEGAVSRSRTDVVIDPDSVIPSLEELLAQIEAMEIATGNANTAAETAVSTANAAAEAATNTANEAAATAKQIAADTAQAAKDTADAAAARADKATEELQGFADSISAQQLLQYDTIPNTTQHYTYDTSGALTAIQHMRDGAAVRTDAFAFGDAEIVETRTLATGEVLTITTDLDTLETAVEYAA